VFPVGPPFGEDTTLIFRPDSRDENGFYWTKVPWVVVGYEGPILIRASRVDGPGAARVEFPGIGRAISDGVLVEPPKRPHPSYIPSVAGMPDALKDRRGTHDVTRAGGRIPVGEQGILQLSHAQHGCSGGPEGLDDHLVGPGELPTQPRSRGPARRSARNPAGLPHRGQQFRGR
jgi:hypothetical protein